MTEDTFYKSRSPLPDRYYTECYNNDRRSRIIVLGCCMRNYKPFCDLHPSVQERHIRKIERSCHNHACVTADKKNVSRNWQNVLFVHLYNEITFRVQKNLVVREHDPASKYLIDKIISGDFDTNNIGKAKSKELCPEKSQYIYDEIEERKQQKIKKKFSSQHECFKCGGRKTTEVEIQLRSLDEGSTLFITCEMDNCTNTWRISS